MIRDDSVAEAIIKKANQLQGLRVNWESHWEEIAERILPNYSTAFNGTGNISKGEKRNQEVFDSTGAIALSRFASAMESMLTPRQQTWHRLAPSDPYLMKDRAVRLWFEDATRILFK